MLLIVSYLYNQNAKVSASDDFIIYWTVDSDSEEITFKVKCATDTLIFSSDCFHC